MAERSRLVVVFAGLGADAPRDRLILALGENTVLAGGGDSPFAFRAVVTESV